MKNHLYTTISIAFALIYWCVESAVHYLIYAEPVLEFLPHDPNELWMRSMIATLLVLFGYFADHHSRRLQEKEKDKLQLFRITVRASNHIINNYLQQMQLFKLEADNCDGFSAEILELFDEAMKNTIDEVHKLNTITDLNESSIKSAIFPQ